MKKSITVSLRRAEFFVAVGVAFDEHFDYSSSMLNALAVASA